MTRKREIPYAKPEMVRQPSATSSEVEHEFEFWDFPSEASVRERPPTFIAKERKSQIAEFLRAGINLPSFDGEELFVVFGLDFGTSSTKMIVRLPYEPGKPVIAIPSPQSAHGGIGRYLWQTVLWLRPDGIFCPWPESDATVLDSLKQGLIQGRSERKISVPKTSISATRAQAVTAYLTFVIRYMKGWLIRNRPELFRGRKPIWLVNLGMPAASYDDLNLTETYRLIGAAALQLSKTDKPVSVKATQLFLNDPHVFNAAKSHDAAEKLGVAVFPEAAAETTAFARSIRGAPGLYLLVDVGALTLDACTFRLSQDSRSGDRYAFLEAQVRPLGVEAYSWFLDEGKTKQGFVAQCERALRKVVWNTKRNRDPNAANWQPGNDVPVFLAGGGAENRLHRDVVESLGPWLAKHSSNDGIRLLKIPTPSAIELPSPCKNFGRLVVAFGLSYPPSDIGQIWRPHEIEDIHPPEIDDPSERFISKDQV